MLLTYMHGASQLLQIVAAVDEELLFSSSQARMEYLKGAIDFDNRLAIKRKQLAGQLSILDRQLSVRPGSQTVSRS